MNNCESLSHRTKNNILIDIFSAHYIFWDRTLSQPSKEKEAEGRGRSKERERAKKEEPKNLIDCRGGGLVESRDDACVPLVKHVYFEGREKDGRRRSLKSNKSREQISPRRKTSFHHMVDIFPTFFS